MNIIWSGSKAVQYIETINVAENIASKDMIKKEFDMNDKLIKRFCIFAQ